MMPIWLHFLSLASVATVAIVAGKRLKDRIYGLECALAAQSALAGLNSATVTPGAFITQTVAASDTLHVSCPMHVSGITVHSTNATTLTVVALA
jgi:hypothetical protein